MIYSATINYNEIGKKLTNRDTYITYVESEYALSEQELIERVHLIVPEMLIESITFNNEGLTRVCPGVFVKLIEPRTTKYSSYLPWRLAKVTDVNDRGIKVEGHSYYFNLEGKEISRKKKDIPYIEYPSGHEINSYNYQIEHDKLVNDLEYMIDCCEHYKLSNNELNEIIDILNS